MIRVLVMIAVAGFLVSVVTISAAVAITGPEAIAHGAWSWSSNGWRSGWISNHGWRRDDGPETTRQIAWAGGDGLDVDLPADVQFTQAPGEPKVTVSGPRDAVADVEIQGDRIRYKDDGDHDSQLTITVTAPSVTRFEMKGSGKLTIAQFNQDKLSLDMSGDADVTATGEAKAVDLDISGSGDADLGSVKAQTAKVQIDGSGDATLAPTDAADVSLSGSGDVTLLTHPAKLQTSLTGSGRIHQKES